MEVKVVYMYLFRQHEALNLYKLVLDPHKNPYQTLINLIEGQQLSVESVALKQSQGGAIGMVSFGNAKFDLKTSITDAIALSLICDVSIHLQMKILDHLSVVSHIKR